MQAKLIRKYSADTALYQVDPPMKFLATCPQGAPTTGEIIVSSKVMLCNCSFDSDYSRTVIHAAADLAGEEGTSYGTGGSRIIDGVSQHSEALALSGYKLSA